MEYYSALKKEGYSDAFYNVDGPWGHQAKWNKLVSQKTNTDEHILGAN